MAYLYPIKPLEGAAFSTNREDETITLTEIADLLNDNEEQQATLDILGIVIEDRKFNVSFFEKGKAYADPNGDRTKTEDEETSMTIEYSFMLPESVSFPLPLKIQLDGWLHAGINFLGRIEVHNTYTIPLTGRGTVALEGRRADAHAGFCTGAACASFQERAALTLAIALACGAQPSSLRELTSKLATIDARYHGRRPIIEYTLHCCLLPKADAGSYNQFFNDYYTYAGWESPSEVVQPLLNNPNARPGEAYFDKLAQKFSNEEIESGVRIVNTEVLNSTDPSEAVEEELYPVLAREGNPIPIMDNNGEFVGHSESLTVLAAHLNDPRLQRRALQKLGFNFDESQYISFQLLEHGKAYANCHGNRSLTNREESDLIISYRTRLPNRLADDYFFPLHVNLGGWLQDGINFLGSIEVKLAPEQRYVIPLTGKGTAALEGRSQDAHAGFCTGAACASFQNRAALTLAIIRCIPSLPDERIEAVAQELEKINACYHGRNDILDYTRYCAVTPSAISYLQFMLGRYDSPVGRPSLLHAMLTTGKPNHGYFQALSKKFSKEELAYERQRHRTPAPVVPTQPTVAPSGIRLENQDKSVATKTSDETASCMDKFTKVAITVAALGGLVIIIVFFSFRK